MSSINSRTRTLWCSDTLILWDHYTLILWEFAGIRPWYSETVKYDALTLWYHDIQLIFWYSDTNTMSLRDYALVTLWGHGTITLWNYDSPIVRYHETMTTLRLWLLWCYQTMILWYLWYYEAIRLWGSATMGESMRVRKSKNRGVLKDSETVILGFYKTMDYDTLMLWYDEVFESKCYYICSCFEYVFVCYQHLYLLTVLLLLFFLASFIHSSEQDQRTKRRHTWSLKKIQEI